MRKKLIERWKKINDFPYSICDMGYVRNNYTGLILKNKKHPKGYILVHLSKNGKQYCKKIHRLVAQAFIPNPLNKEQVNHINGIKDDNRIVNLEWNTPKENINNAIKLFGPLHFASMYGKTSSKNPCSIKVIQYSMNGEFIKKWDCIKDIERELCVNHQNIIHNLKGRTNYAYGFKWKYDK